MKLSIFAWLMFVILVHCVSFVEYQSFTQLSIFYTVFFCELRMRVLTRFLFVDFKFAGFLKLYTVYDYANDLYDEIPTKKEPIRMPQFIFRLPLP